MRSFANAAQNSQQSFQAAHRLKEELQINQNDETTRIRLAEILQRQGLFDDAIELYRECLRLKPNSPWLYGKIARACFCKDSIQDAILAYQVGLALAPNNFGLCRGLAQLYRDVNLVESARQQYSEMLSRWPTKPELLYDVAVFCIVQGDLTSAITYYEGLARVSKGSFVHLSKTADFEHRYLEDYASALKNYEAALGFNSDYLDAHSGILNVLFAGHNLPEAEAKSKYLIETFSFSPSGFCGLAQVHEQAKNMNIALDCWLECHSRFPDNHFVLRRLAQIQAQMGLLTESSDTYASICQLFPANPSGFAGLVDVAKLALDYDAALCACDRLIRLFPAYIEGYIKRALILLRLDRLQEAEAFLRQHLQRETDLCTGLRVLYSESRDLKGSLFYAVKTYELSPSTDTYAHALSAAIRSGEIEQVEMLLDGLCDENIFFSRHPIAVLLRKLAHFSSLGFIDRSWALLQSVFSFYSRSCSRHQRIFKHDSIILTAVFLGFLRDCLRYKRPDKANILLKAAESFHGLHDHPWTLSCANYLIGAYYREISAMETAVSYFETGLSLNPSSDYFLPQIKQALQKEYKEVPDQLFSGPTTGAALMIITCRANLHKADYIRERYYKSLGIPYCFVIGDPFLVREWVAEGDILYVKCPDNYESLSTKVLKAFSFFHVCTDFSGVLKLDDDCAITSISRFREVMQQFFNDPPSDFMGTICGPTVGRAWHFGKCADENISHRPYALPPQVEWCGGGEGYYLSKKSLRYLFEYTTKYPDVLLGHLYEDVFIAFCLSSYGIKPVNYSLPARGLILVDSRISAASLMQSDAADILISDGLRYASAGQHHLAIVAIQKALAVNPGYSPEAYTCLADAFHHENLDEDAITTLLAGVSRFPGCASLRQRLDQLTA
ncbi:MULTISPECIES: tetratricopeptide repeat protein [unclassified Synechococcus]|uniref:tetratricopeptide repeat protein n=1 Tax=Synechococcales TaxID=1890424 RepID=UPI001628B224|nr:MULTISPECIES: tetratricopeptide repeat protein [unclassified Synechococcus]